jgi:hypothetical protein
MRIRSLTLEDLDLFVEAAGFPDHRKEVEQYLKSMFAAGSMRPEWCFVAEDERDRRVGRVAFWTLPGTEAPFALVLLDVDWGGDHAGTGERLLEDALLRRLMSNCGQRGRSRNSMLVPNLRPKVVPHGSRLLPGLIVRTRGDWWQEHHPSPLRTKPGRPVLLSDPEVMTLAILAH